LSRGAAAPRRVDDELGEVDGQARRQSPILRLSKVGYHNFLGPFVGHNDAPGIAMPPPKGSRYYFGLTPSSAVIGQGVASLVRDQLAVSKAAFKMEKIPRHWVTIQPPA
jgi:hypothetical protein